MAISFLILGIGVIVAGILLFYKENIEDGVVTAASGVITEILSTVVFVFNKQANNRLDAIKKDLMNIDRTRLSLEAVDLITDNSDRDRYINDVIRNLNK